LALLQGAELHESVIVRHKIGTNVITEPNLPPVLIVASGTAIADDANMRIESGYSIQY